MTTKKLCRFHACLYGSTRNGSALGAPFFDEGTADVCQLCTQRGKLQNCGEQFKEAHRQGVIGRVNRQG